MADETNPHLVLTARFADAVAWASELHAEQSRKDSSIPYITHLLGAASFLVEQPGTTEDQAIAALLHDAIEDTTATEADIAARFGGEVAKIVADCTDAETIPKPPWRHRKEQYLAHLEHAPVASLQVSLADKLHNARALAADYERIGDELWQRFNAPPVAQRWYYGSLAEVFSRRVGNVVANAFAATVDRLTANLPDDIVLEHRTNRPGWVATDRITGAVATLDELPHTGCPAVKAVGEGAWASTDGRWWVEEVPAGDPNRLLTVFVAPLDH